MQESGETYLETILLLQQQQQQIRAIDLALTLGYSKASVSRALGILKKQGYLVVADGGTLELTPQGKLKATSIYERHCVIATFLQDTLGISKTLAETDACRIEHILSEETFEQMKRTVAEKKL